jgi:hypothetical protein
VPAFIVEKSPGTASANAGNDVVGKPGRLVDAQPAGVHEHERDLKTRAG